MSDKKYHPINEYALIGNCKTSALIHKLGSIDLFCYPKFDSESLFAKVLDHKKGGYFNIVPKFDVVNSSQNYLLHTNVLVTRFFSENNTIDIIDFMPVQEDFNHLNQIIRIVKSVRGNPEFSFQLQLAPDYGRMQPEITKSSDRYFDCIIDKEEKSKITFKSNIDLFSENEEFIKSFKLNEGNSAIFIIGETDESVNNKITIEKYANKALNTTVDYWRTWINQCKITTGRFIENIKRSALVLKLLTSHEFGSTVAAGSFSFPEKIGDSRNYDYRFTWIRDAAFTMYAFMRLGFLDEAFNFMKWIFKRIEKDLSGKVNLQIMYKIDGSKELKEEELDLEGYKKSSPVRIGNAASEQIQMDIFGELMDTIYIYDKYGEPITFTFWQRLEKLLDFVCKNWDTADHGIWEVRDKKRHYLYTRVMCWVALDRAIRLVRKRSFPTDFKKWNETKNKIYLDIHKNFWNDDLQSFVHFKGAKTVDCSMLIMPLVRMISPFDKKWIDTIKVIEDQLVSDVLVYRNMKDSIPKKDKKIEGAFLIGSFWYVECLARGGKTKKATAYFEKLLNHGNHLGLFAEEMSLSGVQLGNFPQAFTHLSLISAAYYLDCKKPSFKNEHKSEFNYF